MYQFASANFLQLFREIYGYRNDVVSFIDFIASPFLDMPRLVPASDGKKIHAETNI